MPCRFPAPSLLFTAIAATIVMLPWAINGLPGDGNAQQAAGAPQLAQQPLTGLGGGETIREVHQDTPFSMVAVTAEDLTATTARVRAKKADGSWGPWYTADKLEGVGPESAAPRGTEPVFVGRTTTVQIAVTRPVGAVGVTTAATKAPAKPGLGYVPADVEHPFAQHFNAVLISPPQAPANALLPSAVTVPGQPPHVISRAQWGADEAMRCGNPVYDNGIRAAVVHHTAGSNDYAPQDSAGIVRSIYEYHARTLGWCDIAYNALVDKYGQVFEGRAGGMDRPVEGSHTGGFNRNTWGVAMMGNFDVVPPTPIQLTTTARLSAGGSGWTTSIRGARWCSRRPAGRSPSSRWARPRRCRRSSPTATSATPTAQATRPMRRWANCATSQRDSTNRQGPRTSRTRCVAERSWPGGIRWVG